MNSSTSASARAVRVTAVDCGVRAMHLRLPFKFGAVTLTRCPQLFVRATVNCGPLGTMQGWAAEMMVPRWFDKRTGPSQADNVRDLQEALQAASAAYIGDDAASVFGLFARHYPALMAAGARRGSTALSTTFGQAVLDRAVLDALCRAAKVSVYDAFRRNLVGLGPTSLADDLRGWDWHAWLPTLTTAPTLDARHTVGMLDVLEGDLEDAAGLPTSLAAVVRRYGHRFFKIKLGGEPAADLQRLDAVLRTLDDVQPGHRFSLDGNEQYADVQALGALCEGLHALPRLAARPDALLYIEQPLARDASMDPTLAALDTPAPWLLDEADGTLDAFPVGRAHGWHGVSSKGCKGLYKSVINRARCDLWNREADASPSPARHRFFMSAEDLTCQAGLSVQQDLALAALLGLQHCERNGHHYVDGFGDAPELERQGFAHAHRDLYDTTGGHPRLTIRQGRIDIGSLAEPGFAHRVEPDFESLEPLSSAPEFV